MVLMMHHPHATNETRSSLWPALRLALGCTEGVHGSQGAGHALHRKPFKGLRCSHSVTKKLATQAQLWFRSLVTPNGTAIRVIRRASNVSLRQLAMRSGLDRSFISRVERGESGASEKSLREIAAALDVPVAAINREEMS
ncbi:helix-turn-helix transcriptional regulator [Kitasatospora sp. NPDC002551]|uniref:helix-turn-helix domain-containing protein n=1 Tax=Kitasatospora sp. NPDC002551 TaxID=3154539 RepID=UPI0033288CA0